MHTSNTHNLNKKIRIMTAEKWLFQYSKRQYVLLQLEKERAQPCKAKQRGNLGGSSRRMEWAITSMPTRRCLTDEPRCVSFRWNLSVQCVCVHHEAKYESKSFTAIDA